MEIEVKKYWTKGDVRKAIFINFVILASIFAFLFFQKINPMTVITEPTPSKAPAFLFNLYGPLGNGFKKPMAVTVLNDRIYVADTFNGRVVAFDYDGRYQFSFGKPGYGKTDFIYPYGITGDSQGNLYVADMKKGAVMVFDENGNYKKLFAKENPKEAVIKNPAGLFLEDGKLYVTDLGRDAVLVFTLNGQLLRTIGKPGQGAGELRAPNAVAVKNDQIYVSDSANDRVVIFDTKGKFINLLGINKEGKSLFINPRGIGIFSDVILVANNISSHVHAFNDKNKEIYAFGQAGPEDGNFGLPNGVFSDERGRVYITDTVNQRVVVYQG